MATKNISISEDAYRTLASLKLPNESFSLVITRLTGKHSLNDLFGVLSKNKASRLEKNTQRVRNERAKADRNRSSRLKEAFK